MPPKQNPGQKPTRKIMAAATGETKPNARLVKRTRPVVLAMPGTSFRHPSPPAIPSAKEARKTSTTSKASTEGSTPQTGKPAKPPKE